MSSPDSITIDGLTYVVLDPWPAGLPDDVVLFSKLAWEAALANLFEGVDEEN